MRGRRLAAGLLRSLTSAGASAGAPAASAEAARHSHASAVVEQMSSGPAAPAAVSGVMESLERLSKLGAAPIDKYMELRQLRSRDPKSYFTTLMQHQEEVLPFIYTPTVGEACQKYHQLPLTPEGVYLRCDQHSGCIAETLRALPHKGVRVVVVTDGERILGLGDLGANGMGIAEGKITLYTAAAGMDPLTCLPVCLDMGTNNQKLLDDPGYKGVRRKRLTGDAFDAFTAEFMAAVRDVFGHCVVQFEDFGNTNAFRLLQGFQARQCCFNDDIQGTAAITLAAVLAALRGSGQGGSLLGQRVMFLGAGEAGTGIGQLMAYSLHRRAGIPMDEALRHCFFVDSKGLVCKSRLSGLQHHKVPFAHDVPFQKDLRSAVEAVRPTVLIGVSTVAGAFDQNICKLMAEYNEYPIIMPLSNPTSKSECTFEQALEWTGGKLIFASGSPFDPIRTASGQLLTPAQANNAYIFPAVGHAASLMRWENITDEMFLFAAEALASQMTVEEIRAGKLFPPFSNILDVSATVMGHLIAEMHPWMGQTAAQWKQRVLSQMWSHGKQQPAAAQSKL
uniref:Malic enzyme n=1 Tax=Chlamydomonas euryale TaxID=1486919 RepID=A0A7R9VBW4_9CHLO|mmetsp:Transcript_28615/g.84711  ORF Transcript_28615/g.84711 Transcript_28615/m.84711 type:complete len:562 (+) Transcript_28615:302-1987(+)